MCTRPSNVRVLFIAGFPRSGTTLLGSLLAEAPGVFHAGEACYLWERLVENETWTGHIPHCGCKAPLRACPVWGEIVDRALEPVSSGTKRSEALELALESQRRAQRSIFNRKARREFCRILTRLYRAMAETSGASVIADSSKSPEYGALLREAPGVECSFVQLVRDPRGVLFSRQRRWLRPTEASPRLRLGRAALDAHRWVRDNRGAARLRGSVPDGRQILVRYEDFVRRPRDVVTTLLDLVGMPGADIRVGADGRAWLGTHHTVRGNRNRFDQGGIRIREDGEWRDALTRSDQRFVALLTAPSFFRYGYSV